jgi:hypothetical protein
MPFELIADYPPSFYYIHRHKAASRVRQELAVSCPSRCIKINVSYREKHASAAGWFEPVTNVLTPFLVYCV